MVTHTQAQRQPHAHRRIRGTVCAALVAAVALVVFGGGVADAGEWVQVSCVNPNQTGAGSAGWSSMIAGGGYGSNSGTPCGPGSPMYAILSTAAAVGVGSAETLHYTPPAGSTLNGGQVDLSMFADGRGYNASGTAVAYTPEYAYNGSNVFFQCASGLAPCANASNDFAGVLAIPGARGGNLYLSAGCGGAAGASCDEGGSNGAWSLLQLWWANLRLSNSSAPSASGVSGTLLAAGARGTQELALTAADPSGPGVYDVTVQADEQTLYAGTPDLNGGQCVAVGNAGGALMFDSSQPCRQSESVDERIDTTLLHDGQHTLKVTIEDAAQNTSVVYDATMTTHNAPASTAPPSLAAFAAAAPGVALAAQTGAWSAPSGAGPITYSYQWEGCDPQGAGCAAIPSGQGATYTPTSADAGHTLRVLVTAADRDGASSLASEPSAAVEAPLVPNGDGASRSARLRLTGPNAISRSFAHRSLQIAGQLLSGDGSPIASAYLDVREQGAGSASDRVIAFAQTSPTGTFAVHIPAGPSRRILLAYRAFTRDPGYTAEAAVAESVSAGVALSVSPRHTSAAGSILLTGHVAGPLPHKGIVVELLVHYRGHWEPFRDTRVDLKGRFRVRYQFQGALGRFPFRAKVLGGQAGYPYDTGESAAVDVNTH